MVVGRGKKSFPGIGKQQEQKYLRLKGMAGLKQQYKIMCVQRGELCREHIIGSFLQTMIRCMDFCLNSMKRLLEGFEHRSSII